MNLRIHFLRGSDDFQAALRKDGWVFFGVHKQQEIDASHPLVKDEDAARNRLHSLGLLTSRSLRIEFPFSWHGDAQRQPGLTSEN
jgi:hypothetical protein